MSIFDTMSIMPDVINESYTIAHARQVFSRMRDRCPKEYEEKKLSIRQAAELLNVDHKTLHQRIRLNLLNPQKEMDENKYIKRMLVSVRDLADMLIEKPLKECSGKPAKRYTKEEIEELKNTGRVASRSYDSYKVKANRLGLSLRKIRAHVQCAEAAADTNEQAETAYNSAMLQGLKPYAGNTGTSA